MAVWAINTYIGLLFLFSWLQVAKRNAAPFGTRIASPRTETDHRQPLRRVNRRKGAPQLNFCYSALTVQGAHYLHHLIVPLVLSVMRTLVALPPHIIGRCVMQRNRFTQTITLGDRLADEAERLRQKARTVPVGGERDSLLRKARQLETAAHVNEWLSSPGLQTPQ
jgi:hypothetical protein